MDGIAKREDAIRTAEEMLTRYIQQRKKPLAELALTTLLELAPNHRLRADYEVWVADLDEEVAFQQRLEEQLEQGLAALATGNVNRARKRLDALRKLEPDGDAANHLAAEIDATAEGQAKRADVQRIKGRIEQRMARGDLERAARDIELLAGLEVPKITLDFLRQQIADARGAVRAKADLDALLAVFRRQEKAGDWRSARDTARELGERFPDSSRVAELFAEVDRLEAKDRRRRSQEEGIATVERFIARGERQQAQLALKLLRSLDISARRLADLERRVARI